MARQYRIISADSHLETDAANWRHRIPEKYRDRGPRLVKTETGGDGWVIEGSQVREVASDLYGGKGRENWKPFGQSYATTPGTGPGEQRVKEMDTDGIDAEVLYPAQASGPNFWRNIKEDKPYLAVVRAYNDWLAEEYCSVAPDRLIGLGIIPMTKIDDAVAELEHIKKLGLKGAMITAFPNNKGYPTKEDDRFWAASLDMEMPVTVHVELNRTGPRDGPILPKRVKELEGEGSFSNIDFPGQVSRFYRAGGLNAVQMVLDGVFDRFPKLKIYFAETHCGWIPIFYHMSDTRWGRHQWWAEELGGWEPLKKKPSEYYREHCYWGFLDDPIGVEMRHHIRVDRMMWATDFPHQESDYPHSMAQLDRIMQGVPEDEKYLMVAGNCIEYFHLDKE
jgi:predicted TIM-barrel fold metal-dependent hydrolase